MKISYYKDSHFIADGRSQFTVYLLSTVFKTCKLNNFNTGKTSIEQSIIWVAATGNTKSVIAVNVSYKI